MRKYTSRIFSTLATFSLLLLLQGCLKDDFRETYRIYRPLFKTLTQVRTEMKTGPAQPMKTIGKLNVYGNYIFLNEVDKGIHVIDNTDPANPRNLSFISIPGNVDLAIKGNYLYADSYSDLVVFDISQPSSISPVRFMDNAFQERNLYWYGNTSPDSIKVVIGYEEKDTTVDYREYRRWSSCSSCLFGDITTGAIFYSSAPSIGKGGSMARFTIVNDYLYAVSSSSIYSISISDPMAPVMSTKRNMGWNIETIYPFQNKLFIGSRTGMFIYGLSNPSAPDQVGQFSHAVSCDPVIADGDYAYVTLRTGTTCNGSLNRLDVLDVSNLSSPALRTTVNMVNPHGLAKDGDRLLICDGKDGLKLFDATQPANPKQVARAAGLETYDVIAMGGTAIVVARDGLYQFDYSDGKSLRQISKLSISNN